MNEDAATPGVSVVICTRNRADRLAQAIAAVIDSMDEAREAGIVSELIIVDNASTDATRDVVAVVRRDPRVSMVFEPRPGIGRARERGCQTARGSVILFTDDDVIVPSQWIARMSRPIRDGEADVVSGGIAVSESLRRPWMTPALAARYFAHNPQPPRVNPGLAGASMGLTAEVATRIGFDDLLGTARWPGAEDVLLYVQAIEAGYRIRGVDDALVEHRFDESRLEPHRLRALAEGYGRCDAYYFHHWLHARLSLPRLRESSHGIRFAMRWVVVRGNPYDEKLLDRRRGIAFHRELRRLRDVPRRYAYRGVGRTRRPARSAAVRSAGMEHPDVLTAAVVIPTFNRPGRVVDCLRHLEQQTRRPQRIVVVDSSSDDRTRDALRAFPEAVYARNPLGRGHTAESRAIGVSLCSEDVIAFLDDDANARTDWLQELLQRYDDPSVAGVGGSALNGYPGERQDGLGSIGLLLPDGRLTGFFAADPGRDVDVDHLLGANMSFRRRAIDAVGGIRGGYPGTCLREESDLALRIGASGGRLVYTPAAVVDHLPGEYAKGRRFDRRYVYFANRNTIVLFARVYGLRSPIMGRYLRLALREVAGELRRAARALAMSPRVRPAATARTVVGGVTRAGAVVAGVAAGYPAAIAGIRADRARRRN